MLDKRIVICGYSGHGLVVSEAALELGINLKCYADRVEMQINPFELAYLGDERKPDFEGWKPEYEFVLGIGNNEIRTRIGNNLHTHGKVMLNVIHPKATVSKTAKLATGIFVAQHSVINTLAKVGEGCIINTGCIVEHECEIGNYTHIAPGAVLAGNVKVGHNTFIGANAVVKQGIAIGNNVIIGAGTVVLNHVPDGKMVVGNPGRIV